MAGPPGRLVGWPGFGSSGSAPDGHRLVVASAHGQIATFDVASGRLLAGPVVAQSGPVLTASFAPDGRTILTSGADGIIRLWEAAHLRPVAEPLHLLPDEGVFAAYTPDGKEVLGLDPTGRVTAWPATVSAWLSRACSIARRDFTPQERTLYSITPAERQALRLTRAGGPALRRVPPPPVPRPAPRGRSPTPGLPPAFRTISRLT